MDDLSRWCTHIVDLRTLFSEWERRRVDGHPWTTRFREIHSVCMFTLLIENGTDQRYLIGFPEVGVADEPATVNQLFDDHFAEIEDVDVVLIDDPKKYGESSVLHHRCQLTSFVYQRSTSESDLVNFLKKKLSVAVDDDLRLVIHVEQEGRFNYAFLSAYLIDHETRCPYRQVFTFGQNGRNPRKWFCVQVYPELNILNELDEHTAKALILDREQYTKMTNTAKAEPADAREPPS